MPRTGYVRCAHHTEIVRVEAGDIFPEGRARKVCAWEYEPEQHIPKEKPRYIAVLSSLAYIVVGVIATIFLTPLIVGILPGPTETADITPLIVMGGKAKGCVEYMFTTYNKDAVDSANLTVTFPSSIVDSKFGIAQTSAGALLFGNELGAGCTIRQLLKYSDYPNMLAAQRGENVINMQAHDLPEQTMLGGIVTLQQIPGKPPKFYDATVTGKYRYTILGQSVTKDLIVTVNPAAVASSAPAPLRPK